MSPKWRSRSDQPGKGKHYPVDEREPTRLPPRAGMDPNDRVAGINDRSLSSNVPLQTVEHHGTLIRHKTAGTEGQIVGSYVAGDSGGFRVYVPKENRSFALPFKDLDNWERVETKGPNWNAEKDYLDGKISQEKYEKERLKREASEMRIKANDEYVRGQITEATWRSKLRRADRICAPSTDEVLTTLEKRSIDQGRPTDFNKQYNGWSNWDTWETKLILDNSEETQRWQNDWGKNWHQKIKAGTFDPEKAESVVPKYMVPVARGKNKRFKMDGGEDPDIDAKKVNKAEIVHNIISDYEQNLKYEEEHSNKKTWKTVDPEKWKKEHPNAIDLESWRKEHFKKVEAGEFKRPCKYCGGSGVDPQTMGKCPDCGGSGKA